MLQKQRLGRMPTFSAGPLVDGKADPRQAHSIAQTTSEGLVGVWFGRSGGGPGLLLSRFSSKTFTTGGFKVIGHFVDSLALSVALCSLGGPLRLQRGLCGRTWRTSLGSPWTFSLGLLCLCGQMIAHHARQSLVGDGLPSLRYGRPSKVGILGVWLWCWWLRPVGGPRHW